MKKILNYLFVAMIAIGSTVSAVNAAVTKGTFADTEGKITIEGTSVNGEDYNAYRILDLESYDSTKGAYSYKVNAKWSAFINGADIKGTYVNVDAQGYVTWISGADAAEFAKKAYAYAKANSIAADATKKGANNKVEFTGLKLGYYLVDSTLGVVCNLNTTNNEITIKEKNSNPTIDKVLSNNQGKVNTASIGDEVPYTVTLNRIGGLKNVKVTDTFTTGLTFNNNIVVKNGSTTLTKGTEYTVNYTEDSQTFTIVFADSYTATLTNNDVITINYSATVNANSVTNVANQNDVELTYGNGAKVEADPVKIYTFGFKFHKVNGERKTLDGAKFKLFDARVDGNEIKVVFVDEIEGVNYYRVALPGETGVEMEAGEVVVEGLAAGTYYLEETKAPEGYNKLAARIPVLVNGLSDTTTPTQDAYNFTDTAVVNTTGTILPSTGGMGTTLFIVIGSMLVIGFGVTLITRYRVSKEFN